MYTPRGQRPTPEFLLAHPAHFVALGFGSGLSPFAAGTVGTLLAFPLYAALVHQLGALGVALLCVPLFALGVWACGRTTYDLGVHDHNGINWDEIVAFMLVLSFTPRGWGWQLFAFLTFRFFDVVKPPPVRQADQRIHGGFGVMLDDILAAAYTLLVLAIAKTIMESMG
jgi:phosphatidylglycerophosphatase A